ncbi:MAG: hypothetical protein U1D30_19700 [Planctomycetota bacterium]
MINLFAWMAVSLSFAAAPTDPSVIRLNPKFTLGQELTFHGSVIESSLGMDGVRFEQPFELEASMFVLDIDASKNAETGCYTVLRLPDHRPTREKKELENVTSLHFDLVKVNSVGAAVWAKSEAQIMLPPDGSAPWELGYFFEVPKSEVKIGDSWTLRRPGQPMIRCQVLGREDVFGIPCAKVLSVQESQNWTTKNKELAAWRNETNVWIEQKSGLPLRVHRQYQFREAGQESVTRSLLTRYDRSSDLKYHGQLFQERESDFRTAIAAQTDLDSALSNPERTNKAKYASIEAKLRYALDRPHGSPYRPAMAHMAKIAGDAVANPRPKSTSRRDALVGPTSQVGRRARPFVVHNLEKDESINLKSAHGRAVVLVFVDPASELSLTALRNVLQAVGDPSADVPRVLAVIKNSDKAAAEVLKTKVPGEYSVCFGKGVDKTYGIDALPHTVFIDAEGTLRGNYVGVGPEVLGSLTESIAQHGKKSTIENVGGTRSRKQETFLR